MQLCVEILEQVALNGQIKQEDSANFPDLQNKPVVTILPSGLLSLRRTSFPIRNALVRKVWQTDALKKIKLRES